MERARAGRTRLAALRTRFRDLARAAGPGRAVLVAPLALARPLYGVHVFAHDSVPASSPFLGAAELVLLERDRLELAAAVHPSIGLEELRRRLDEGQEGRVLLEEGEPVYLRWDVFVDHRLPYLKAIFRLAPGDHHPSGAYTRADRRGRGLHGRLLDWSLGEARRRGCRRSIGFVPSWNRPALAAVEKPGWSRVGAVGYWSLPAGPRHFARGAVRLEPGPGFRVDETRSYA